MDDSPNQPMIKERMQGTDQRSSVGPVAAIVIVVILLALGGVYFFITQKMKLNQTSTQQT